MRKFIYFGIFYSMLSCASSLEETIALSEENPSIKAVMQQAKVYKKLHNAIKVFEDGLNLAEKIRDLDGKRDHISKIMKEISNTNEIQLKQILQQGTDLKQSGQLDEAIKVFEKAKSYIEQAKIPMPERMETYNFLHRTPLTEIFAVDFLAQINLNTPLENLEATYNRANSSVLLKKMLFLDAKFTLADNDLRKVNRMGELAGVEVRYPFLQENLVEFAASIPSKLLIRNFELRSFFRKSMRDFLAPETLDKNKQGFGLPFGVWMNNHAGLKEFADANLHGIEKRNILNPDYIKNIIQAQQKGHARRQNLKIY